MDTLASATGEVDTWRINLAGEIEQIEQCRCVLSPDEVERADRFRFERERRRFIVVRAATREILGHYAGVAAKDLCFSYGPKGKPEIAGSPDEFWIKFNCPTRQSLLG